MKKRTAAAIRTWPDTVTPAYLFKSQAVAGQAETPESTANQPFVSGHGPFVQRSHKPPPAATIVHAQAATQPSIAPNVIRLTVFRFTFASLDSIDYAFRSDFKLRHYRHMPHARSRVLLRRFFGCEEEGVCQQGQADQQRNQAGEINRLFVRQPVQKRHHTDAHDGGDQSA